VWGWCGDGLKNLWATRELTGIVSREGETAVINRLLRFVVPRIVGRLPTVVEEMKLEDVEKLMGITPQLMESYFSKAGPEQREVMLSISRGVLDQIEQKYSSSGS
jgi:hypothetical protein